MNLTKAGLATAVEHSSRGGKALAWQVPEGVENKTIALYSKQGRTSGVTLLSVQHLNVQFARPGAIWLDRTQASWGNGRVEKISSRQSAFYLVPWQSIHAQTWCKRKRGRVLSGGGIDWNAGRSRGIARCPAILQ